MDHNDCKGKFMTLLAVTQLALPNLSPTPPPFPFSSFTLSPKYMFRPVQTCCPTRSSSLWGYRLSPGRRLSQRKYTAQGPQVCGRAVGKQQGSVLFRRPSVTWALAAQKTGIFHEGQGGPDPRHLIVFAACFFLGLFLQRSSQNSSTRPAGRTSASRSSHRSGADTGGVTAFLRVPGGPLVTHWVSETLFPHVSLPGDRGLPRHVCQGPA